MKHINGLDPLRGIAALSIVILHFTSYLAADIGIFVSKATPVITNLYLFVDLFFILSGFVLTHNYLAVFNEKVELKKYTQFMKKRFLRIYPLHIVTLIILVIMHWGIFKVFPASIDDSFFIFRNKFSLLTNIFLIQSMGIGDNGCFNCTSWNYPAWSISVEWLTYFFVPFYIFLISKFKKISILLLSIGLFILYWRVEKPIGHLDVASYYGWYRCLVEVFLGSVLYKVTYSKWKTNQNTLFVLLFLLFPVLHFNQVALLTVIYFAILISFVGNGSKTKILDNKLFIWLGKRSYSIYLVHVLVQDSTSYLVRYFIHKEVRELSFITQISLAIFLVLIVILLSDVTYKYIENRLQRKLKSLIY